MNVKPNIPSDCISAMGSCDHGKTVFFVDYENSSLGEYPYTPELETYIVSVLQCMLDHVSFQLGLAREWREGKAS